MRAFFAACALTALLARPALPENAIAPGTPAADPPTVVCLGVWWPYTGDDNANASVAVRYRMKGSGEDAWREAMPLFRIRTEDLPADEFAPKALPRAFAGSVFDLKPGTEYEIELSLTDPDGGSVRKMLASTTMKVPYAPEGLEVVKVAPGGLEEALRNAKAGQVLLLGKGTHTGNFKVSVQATAEKPFVIRGESQEAVLDGGGGGSILDVSGTAFVYVEGLTFRNGCEAVRAHSADGLVVRRCLIDGLGWGIRNTVREKPGRDFYIADNVFRGPCAWPAPQGKIEGEEAVEVLGSGHVVCYNSFKGYGDCISIYRNPAVSIDFYNNEMDTATDDGIEMDYSDRNTRCFRNRVTNARVGYSLQPIYGGPCYVIANEAFNTQYTIFKLHNQPSGGVLLHNTSVRQGTPLVVWSTIPVVNFIFRNNLFIGTDERMANWTSKNIGVDLDYDAYGPGKIKFKVSNEWYESLEDARKRGGIELHGLNLDPPFFAGEVKIPADPTQHVEPIDPELAEGSRAVDAGIRIPNINDGFKGKAPDIGSREKGGIPPHFGPRPEHTDELTDYEKRIAAAGDEEKR